MSNEIQTFDLTPIKGGICAIDGIFCDGVAAGLKKNEALDVAWIFSQKPLEISAVFTKNRFQAAPILHFLRHAKGKTSNFFLINTKNANAMTGERGVRDIEEILAALSARFPQVSNPIMSSTGVIGQFLPKDKIIAAFEKFDLSAKRPERAAEAILTTDRFAKSVAFRVDVGAGSFVVAGFAKGAGMISPNLATMLCYIFTDSRVPKPDAEAILGECARESFNAISVDGDTSTNDSVFLCTTNAAIYERNAFKTALLAVMKKLALDIVRDGEGSTRVVAFEVRGAKDDSEAERAAKALSNSLLVKTALFGCDPNWGRIASTIGACGIDADPSRLKISIGEVLLFDCGAILMQDSSVEAKAAAVMREESFRVTCEIGVGEGRFVAYGCDLGHKYVEINSDYRS